MFQFTTTTILNSEKAVDVQGNVLLDAKGKDVNRFRAIGDKFQVHGTGTFRKDAIQSVYKREAAPGKLGEIKITVPALGANNLARMAVEVKLNGRVQGDYTNFQGNFTRPAVIDIVATGTPATDAEEFVKLFNKLRTEYGYSMFVASNAEAVITFKARENGQILTATLSEITGTDALRPVITEKATSTETVKGNPGFGDTNWMLRTVTLPTYDNNRHFGVNRDERPIAGESYDQFTLRYKVASGEDCVYDGDKKSITTHVFWVRSGAVSKAFELALSGVFSDIEKVWDDPLKNRESKPGSVPGSNTDADDLDPKTGKTPETGGTETQG